MISLDYVAYCLDCDTQLGESGVKLHKCLEEADE
jgi:hypothetical protein